MDNASYPSSLVEKLPNFSWRKSEIRDWLQEINLVFPSDALKVNLPKLVSWEKCLAMWQKGIGTATPEMCRNTVENTNKIILDWLQRKIRFGREDVVSLIINLEDDYDNSEDFEFGDELADRSVSLDQGKEIAPTELDDCGSFGKERRYSMIV
ncbi:hypothetical protein ILUMI_22728 [Ignelater luminosus]|uniref:Uncharacterized protein n=1 Tax=Ignelater luminosus TaxID=2038154 RepID=A0A8K0CF88_IGNLU|nr:hypothetical protein ILUMI_22728 [Ignelater luminosus]